MKEQEYFQEEERDEMEASNLSDREVRVLIISTDYYWVLSSMKKYIEAIKKDSQE